MGFTVRLSVREHGYLAALTAAIVERTLLRGVDWQDAFLPWIGLGALLLDALLLLLLSLSFLWDVLARRRLHHLITLLALGLLAVSAGITRETGLLYSAAFILLARDIPFEKIARVFFRAGLSALLLLIFAQAAGLTKRSVMDLEYSLGYAMGMAHPNNFASAVTVLLFAWAYLRRWGRRWAVILTCLGLAFALYRYTLSRTALVIALAYCLALILYGALRRLRARGAVKLIRWGFAALLAASVWLMLHADETLAALGVKEGPLLSALSRFVNASALYRRNGLRLFGSYIEFRSLRTALRTNQEAVILDSAYLYLVISQGAAAALIVLWLFASAMGAQIRKKQDVLLITMGVFMLSGLMERFALDAAMNFALLSAFSALEPDTPERKHPGGRVRLVCRPRRAKRTENRVGLYAAHRE